MVAATMSNHQNGVMNATGTGVLANADLQGNFTLVGIDIDTTGRRLIDEIVQLAAYTPKDHFEQYIMPYMNLNPAARQRHQVRVISIGFYRMLKSMQTYKIIKSKSEIAALKDFLDWLENLKDKDATSQGIILVYHEERKFIPYMILESLKKYNLLDRFLATVKGFANGLNLAKDNANESLQHYNLRKLSKVLNAKLNENARSAGDNEVNTTTNDSPQKNQGGAVGQSHERDLFDGNASVRAKLAYEVAFQLSNLKCKESFQEPGSVDAMLSAILPYAQAISSDLNELQTQNENLERQNSFRPVFLNYFKTTLYHRVRAVKFRIILAEQGYDLQTLNAIWSEKQKDGLIEVLQIIDELKEEDKAELAELFDSYFDPAKTTIKPVVKTNNRRRNRRGMRNSKPDGNNNKGARGGTEHGAGGDKPGAANHLPDSTTKSPTQPTANGIGGAGAGAGAGAGTPQRKRHPRMRNNSINTQTPPVAEAHSANSPTSTTPNATPTGGMASAIVSSN